MWIFAIILVPLIFIFNAFFLGRLVKRKLLSLNDYLSFAMGMIAFFAILYIFSLPLYMLRASLVFTCSFFLIIQILLIVVYASNWRYIFITRSFNKRHLVFFTLLFLLTILICFLNQRPYISDEGIIAVNQIIQPLDWNQVIYFGSDESFNMSNFSFWSVANIMWINLFSITDSNQIIEFANWAPALIYTTLIASVFIGGFYHQIVYFKWFQFIFLTIGCGVTTVLSLLFYESFLIGISWTPVIIVIFSLICFTNLNSSKINLNIIFINLIILMGSAMSADFVLIATILFLFVSFYYALFRLEPFDNMIRLLLPYLLVSCIFISIFSMIVGVTIFFSCLVLYIIYFFIRKKKNYISISWKISKWLSDNLKIISLSFIGILFLTSLILFGTVFDLKFYIYYWDPKYMWGIDVSLGELKIIVETICWAAYLVIIILSVFVLVWKRKKLINHSELLLSLFSAIVFVNPVTLNLLVPFAEISGLNLQILNFLIWIPPVMKATDSLLTISNPAVSFNWR